MHAMMMLVRVGAASAVHGGRAWRPPPCFSLVYASTGRCEGALPHSLLVTILAEKRAVSAQGGHQIKAGMVSPNIHRLEDSWLSRTAQVRDT